MDNTDEYKDLVTHIDENYEDIEDNILASLESRDEEFCALLHESSELDFHHPFIGKLIHDEDAISLTAEEHQILLQYLDIDRHIDAIERREIYFRGHTDNYAYMKRVGALKD